MPETRKAQWVRCEGCGQEWLGFYLPMQVDRLNKIVKHMCCPSCAGDNSQIYMTKTIISEIKEAKAMDALAGVDNFVRDLSPFADPSHSPATALARACEVYAELTGGPKNGNE